MDSKTFESEFGEIEASFNRSMQVKFKNRWFEKIKRLDEKAALGALRSLASGSKWPTFGDFENQYRIELGKGPYRYEKVGCQFCVTGFLLFFQDNPDTGEEMAVSAMCARCHPKSERRLDPRDPVIKKWVIDPKKWNEEEAERRYRQRKQTYEAARENITKIKELVNNAIKNTNKTQTGEENPAKEKTRKALKKKEGFGVETSPPKVGRQG